MITLLKGHSLEAKETFRVETMQLTLYGRQSSASFTVGPEAPALKAGDWVKDNTDPGKGIVWRIKSMDEDYNTGTRTAQLEHVIQILKDTVMFGEISTDALGGGDAKAAVQYVLSRQGDWVLQDFGYHVHNDYEFNSDSILSALETIDKTLDDSAWQMNTNVYPFRLSIMPADANVTSELRMSRNITTAKRTLDRSRMYTRFYPIGKDNIHISGDYMERNTDLYGVIRKVETNQNLDSEAKLREWARQRLLKHAEPSVTVTVTGLDLSAATGEQLDKLTEGRICRMPLPEYGTTITERISKLQYRDKINQPEVVNITLANTYEDVTNILKQLIDSAGPSGSGGGGRGGAKKAGEDHAWFVDTTDHVGMVAEAVAGPGADKDWSRVSSIYVDGTGIHQKVTKAEEDIVVAQSRIDQTEDSISVVVEGKGKDGKPKAASIVSAINNAGSSVQISADHIMLDGKTTIKRLLTGDAAIASLKVNDLLIAPNSGMGYVRIANAIADLKIERSGNTYTLKKTSFTDAGWKDVGTFSRATTLTGSWSSGTLTIKAAPQDQKFTSTLYTGVTSWSGNLATVPIYAVDSDRPSSDQNTGRQIQVDATARYKAGQATRPTVSTNTSASPSGATSLGTELYISASIKSIVINIGGNRWYAKVTK